MKDPYSAQVSCSPPKKGWVEVTTLPDVYGYVSVCEVNAKNGFGAYTGTEQNFYYFLGNGEFGQIPHTIVSTGNFEFHPVP